MKKSFGFSRTPTGVTIQAPRFARFKAAIRFRGKHGNGSAYYFSYDVQPKFIDGVPFYYRSERIGFDKLVEMIQRKKPWQYYAATIFANLTEDLSTDSKKYDHPIITLYPDKAPEGITLLWEEYVSTKNSNIICTRVNVRDTLFRLDNTKQNKLL